MTVKRRDIRRLAMQVLYQIGMTGDTDRATIAADLSPSGATHSNDHDQDMPDPADDPAAVREAGIDLALAAWAAHETADQVITELTPDWPTHRQPSVDRAILRLAHYEMTSGHAPVKVVINEAIELAKAYASEQSPSFVNGVLDKLARQQGTPVDGDAADAPVTNEAWLDDAVQG